MIHDNSPFAGRVGLPGDASVSENPATQLSKETESGFFTKKHPAIYFVLRTRPSIF